MGTKSPLETRSETIGLTARLQRLYVELLFCEHLRQHWIKDQHAVLEKYMLPPESLNILPDIGSNEFTNECIGRRTLISRELQPKFSKTLESAYGIESIRDFGSSDVFQKFLESPHFLTIEHSLPHPYGIGKGYENSSKFFLWLRDVNLANRQQLRLQLHQDFSVHLIRQSPHCLAYPLIRSRKGVLFRADARNDDDDWLLVDKDLRVLRFCIQDLPTFLSSPGFFLDRVDEAGNYTELTARRHESDS